MVSFRGICEMFLTLAIQYASILWLVMCVFRLNVPPTALKIKVMIQQTGDEWLDELMDVWMKIINTNNQVIFTSA